MFLLQPVHVSIVTGARDSVLYIESGSSVFVYNSKYRTFLFYGNKNALNILLFLNFLCFMSKKTEN